MDRFLNSGIGISINVNNFLIYKDFDGDMVVKYKMNTKSIVKVVIEGMTLASILLLLVIGELPGTYRIIIGLATVFFMFVPKSNKKLISIVLSIVLIINILLSTEKAYAFIRRLSVTRPIEYSQILYTVGQEANLLIPRLLRDKTVYVSSEDLNSIYFSHYAKEVIIDNEINGSQIEQRKDQLHKIENLELHAIRYFVGRDGGLMALYLDESVITDKEVVLWSDKEGNLYIIGER